MGRGVAEQIIYGGFKSMDLTPFLNARFARGSEWWSGR